MSSHIVRSLAGHDKGRLYLVLEADSGIALLSDGKVRRLDNPKRKKLKHLEFLEAGESPAGRSTATGGQITNKEIVKTLAAHRRLGQMTEEGKVAWQKTM